jgi:hypothetical protein
MPTKRDVLALLTRDELVAVVDRFELQVPDRRVRDGLIEAVAASKKATWAELLVGVAISVGIVAAGIGAIVIACDMIFEAWALEAMRDETIPALTDAATQGYMAALKKEAEGAAERARPKTSRPPTRRASRLERRSARTS